MHLNASGLLVVDGEVLKLPKIEISFASRSMRQQTAVECCLAINSLSLLRSVLIRSGGKRSPMPCQNQRAVNS